MSFVLKNLISCFVIVILLNSCGGFKRTKTSIDQPVNAGDRVKKNIEEGRGLRLSSSITNNNLGGGSFSFASSNPLWRATLEKLDFIPLSNVDYAGGVIITDWYGDVGSEEQIKVAVKFLTTEIRSDALEVIIYEKRCIKINSCQTLKLNNSTGNEIKASILKRAAVLSKELEAKKDD